MYAAHGNAALTTLVAIPATLLHLRGLGGEGGMLGSGTSGGSGLSHGAHISHASAGMRIMGQGTDEKAFAKCNSDGILPLVPKSRKVSQPLL